MDDKHDAIAVETGTTNGENESPAVEMRTMTKGNNETSRGSEVAEVEYPALPALICLTVALCLGVLPVALVRTTLLLSLDES